MVTVGILTRRSCRGGVLRVCTIMLFTMLHHPLQTTPLRM